MGVKRRKYVNRRKGATLEGTVEIAMISQKRISVVGKKCETNGRRQRTYDTATKPESERKRGNTRAGGERESNRRERERKRRKEAGEKGKKREEEKEEGRAAEAYKREVERTKRKKKREE